MKRHSFARRLAAGAAGVLVGAVGAIAFAAPASAVVDEEGASGNVTGGKKTSVSGSAICDPETGVTEVEWTVKNKSPFQATISEIGLVVDGEEVEDAAVEGLEPNTVVTKDHPAIVTQSFDPGTETVELEVTLRWWWTTTSWEWEPSPWPWKKGSWVKVTHEHEKTSTDSALVGCEIEVPDDPEPVATPELIAVYTCDLLVIIIDNEQGSYPAQVTLTPNQTTAHGHAEGFTYTVETVGEGEEQQQELEIQVAEDAGITDPLGDADADNPVVVGPFEVGAFHNHGFEAAAGLEITVGLELEIDGELVQINLDDNTEDPTEVVRYDDEAPECPEDGEGGELPVTGMNTGLMALGAVALLAIGGGLFMIARRRRVTFTA